MAALIEAIERSTPSTIDTHPPHTKTHAAWTPEIKLEDRCPECRVSNTVTEYTDGDVVCGECGLVLGDRIVDTRSEWRTFSSDDTSGVDPCRVGAGINPLLHGEQLTTIIAYKRPSRAIMTTSAAARGGANGRALQRAQARATENKADQSLFAVYERISAFCASMSIQNVVVETAKVLFKQLDDARVVRGKPVDIVVAGCIFLACRQCGVPRTFREVFAMTSVPKKDIGRVYKIIERFFNKQGMAAMGAEESGAGDGGYRVTETTKPYELIHRYCSALKIDQRCTSVSAALAARIAELGSVTGRSPISGAAACIYMVSHLLGTPRTMKEISEVAGVSTPTIRIAYKHLYNDREKLIYPKWLEEVKGDVKKLPRA